MSVITTCPKCGGNIIRPAFEGDGDYPVEPMCRCHVMTERDIRIRQRLEDSLNRIAERMDDEEEVAP